MTRACHIAVRAATGEVFSEKEIDDFLDRLAERAKRAGKDAPGLSEREAIAQAAGELTREQLMESLIQRRLDVAAKAAAVARRARLDAMPASMSEAMRLDAYNVGKETQGLATSSSVDAEGRARQMSLWGKVELGLQQMPGLINRISNPWGRSEPGIDRRIAKEMARLNGDGSVQPTGDAGALHAARVFVAAMEEARGMQNELGAWIGRQVGYVARQSHDGNKVAGGFWREVAEAGRRAKATGLKDLDWNQVRQAAEARAFGTWRDEIMPRLDPKTFEGLELEDVPFTRWEDEAQAGRQYGRQKDLQTARDLAARGILRDPTDLRELMLHRVWMDIVTGRHAELSGQGDEADFRPAPSLAGKVSKARVLHFKDPDAWCDYNEKFGRSSLFAAIMQQLERAGRNAALLERWGPSPEAAWEAEKSRLTDQARARGDVGAVKQLDGYMRQANFDAVMGRAETPENLRLAQVMRTLRGWEAVTKLGGIVLSKATDLPITGQTMARAGAGYLAGYRGFFQGVLHLGGAEARRAADALDVGARSFAGHLGGQYLASDGAPGWTSWATRLMYKINAFEWFNNAVRHGAAEVYAAHLGDEASRAWDGLDAGTRETFERFGIAPEDWEAVRHGLEKASDGRTYFTLDHLERLAAEAPDKARAIGRTRLKFQAMIHNVLDDTVSEPRARERAQIVRGTRPGTLQGEIMRSFFQFKGFINTIVGRHLTAAATGFAGVTPAAAIAHLVIGTTLAGWISMNLKSIARGETPRGLVGEDAGETAKIWTAAMAQGGGLGIYGDFLFGEHSRAGGDFGWGQLGGPILSDSEQVAKLVLQAVHGGAISEATGASPIPGELVRLGSRNIPVVNVFYTRLALDYLILWRLQEAASPGYLQRYEDRVRNQDGRDFILPPTSAQ